MLGIAAALLVLAQAVLLARVAARAFDGAALARPWRRSLFLLVAVVARALATWGFEVAGRRAAGGVLSQLRLELVERGCGAPGRARRRAERARSRPRRSAGVDALETLFARYLPQLVLAVVVPVAVLVAGRLDRPRSPPG